MRNFLFISVLFTNIAAFAKVSVLFHPYDNTLEAIAERIEKAQHSVDIAMYNVDGTLKNPVVRALSSQKLQKRIQSGELKVRLIYEGYEEPEKKLVKMQLLEDLGVDVRYMGLSKKMHHKFAVIDGGEDNASLITGSANWSLSSQNNYNENILFFDQEPGIAKTFAEQYSYLWENAKELGKAGGAVSEFNSSELEPGIEVHFNTDNFKFQKGKLSNNSAAEGFALTRAIVDAIDQAQDRVEIATTRLKLRPIYEAILRAAQRGVKVDLVVTMGEYEYKSTRFKKQVKECDDIYIAECSAGENYASFLSREDIPGHENIDVRIKYFHIKKEVYLSKQMHSKYLIVDRKKVLTGSFNWSYSAEYNHIENVVALDGAVYPEAVESFTQDFDRLWKQNRNEYSKLIQTITDALEGNYKVDCGFAPISLEYQEVDHLLATGTRVGGKATNDACKSTSDAEKGTGEE